MAELRSTAAVGGNLIWHRGNLRFSPQDDSILYSGYKVYTEKDTPHPNELGNGSGTSAYTKEQSDARFSPIWAAGYVKKDGDIMSGKLTNTANDIEITGASSRLTLTTSSKKWFVLNDGSELSVREDSISTSRVRIGSSYVNLVLDDLEFNGKIAMRGFDAWLRINDQAEFTTGVYFGQSLVRTDGTIQIGSSGSVLNVNQYDFTYNGNTVYHDAYHPVADAWTTPRNFTITLSGDVSGTRTVSVDGSENETFAITTTVANDSHTHDGRYYTETESDNRFVNVTGDTMTGNLVISKALPSLSLVNSNYATPSVIEFTTTENQDVQIVHQISDTQIVSDDGNGQAIIISQSGSTSAVVGLEVEGEIYANDGQRVYHDAYHPVADTWTTARTLTVGNTGKIVNGSSNVTWSEYEINGYNYGGVYRYVDGYTVNKDAPAKILNQDGDTIAGGALRVRAVIRSTGTGNTISSAVFVYQGGSGWKVNVTGGVENPSSNQIVFFVDEDGDPAVKTGHASNYLVTCYHEYYEDQRSDNQSKYDLEFFGADGVISLLSDIPYITRNATQYRLFDEAYHPNADIWTTARTLTIGDTGKTVDGSGDVTWTASEIGVYTTAEADAKFAPISGGDGYVQKTGDTMSGDLNIIKAANITSEIGLYESDGTYGAIFRYDGTANMLVNATYSDGTEYIQSYSPRAQAATYFTGNLYANAGDLTSSGQRVFADNYHPNADTWTTARTITLDGDIVGSVSIDGSSDVTITTSVNGGSVDNAVEAEHALEADVWTNARTITLDGVVAGSVSIDGSSDVTITTTHTDVQFGANGWDNIVSKIPGVNTVGLMAIGKYLDFTDTDSTADYDARLTCTSGTLTLTGAFVATQDITAFSDRRLKTNIEKIDHALAKVQQLNGYTYERTDTQGRQTGVIAQEVHAILPEAVRTDSDTGLMSVAYGNLSGLLIESIKELGDKVNRLERELEASKTPFYKKAFAKIKDVICRSK